MLIPLLLLRWRINLLTLSEEEAETMGIHSGRLRLAVILCATILTAASVSVSGMIGWVGLVIPHFARQMAGSDHRRMLPVCALLGAVAMVLVYTAALCTGFTTSINLITSLVGGALFLVFMLKYRRARNADWA